MDARSVGVVLSCSLRSLFVWILVGLLIPLTTACREGRRSVSSRAVTRGEITSTFLLTGEIEAASSEPIVVPVTPSWQIQLRWLAEDGIDVAPGDRLAEFDSGDLTRRLADAELDLAQAREDLARLAAEAAQDDAVKRFAVDEARSRAASAELDAAVPAELLAARTFQERQLALARARAALEKAEGGLGVTRVQIEADRSVADLKRAKAERARATAASALSSLIGRAPRAGVFVVSRHPWEARKVQVGDDLYPGLEVGALPDLGSLRVRAVLFDVDREVLEVGQEGTCTLDAFPGEPIPCRVADISPLAREADRQSLRRTFTARLVLARVDPGRMRPGQSVRAEITIGRAVDVVTVPRSALDLTGDPAAALLSTGERRAIQLGLCDAARCAVEKGLAEGERLAMGSGQ